MSNEKTELEEFVRTLVYGQTPNVVTRLKATSEIPEITKYLKELGITTLWVDSQGSIGSKLDVMSAFDATLQLNYIEPLNNWDTLQDLLYSLELLPDDGCVLFFSTLSSLKKIDRQSYDTLIDILTTVSTVLREQEYFLKTLIST